MKKEKKNPLQQEEKSEKVAKTRKPRRLNAKNGVRSKLELLPPPAYFDETARKCWHQLAAHMLALGVLDGTDHRALEMACVAYSEFRKAQRVCADEGLTYKTFTQSGELRWLKRPEADIMASAWSRLLTLLPQLCLTPSARMRTVAPGGKKGDEDPFSEFLAEVSSEVAS